MPTALEGDTPSAGSINLSMSRRLSANEIEIAREHLLNKLNAEEKQLSEQIHAKKATEYFTGIDQSHDLGDSKYDNRKVRAQKACIKKDRQKAVEGRPYAKHDTRWKMKINAGNVIMRKFTGNGPTPPSDMPVLKEGTEIWPVLPERFGSGRLPGKPSWYRTQNGNLFGDQKVEDFPEHYKVQVLRNAKIKAKNETIRHHKEERRLAIAKVRELNTKPQRPWSAVPGGNIFSMLTSMRPPTSMERKRMNALPSRALAGHRVGNNPTWKCR